MQDTVGAQGVETKTRVFISYSRKDIAFANRLEVALKARGFEVLIDREEIYAFEDWWKRIEALIGRADTVVFVLSPDAAKSDVALKEVAYAALLNKRFAPIVCRRVEDDAAPKTLRRLNFIFFDEPDRFDESANKLADAVQTDIVWIRDHTKFGEAARAWVAAGRLNALLLRTPVLEMAEYWMASRPRGAPEPTDEIRSYVAASRQGARSAQSLRRFAQGSILVLMMAVILGLIGWINQEHLKAQARWWLHDRHLVASNIWPYVLNPATERALKPNPNKSFRECAPEQQDKDYCPDMVVVPAGSFTMGSAATEKGRSTNEGPQHAVTIAKAFAVSKYEVTFAEWDTCVAYGGCNGYSPSDAGLGRGRRPLIYMDWLDAKAYVTWLSQMTGKPYRQLTEAEYEYATRAGTTTAYPWGDDSGNDNANCIGCSRKWDKGRIVPVGSFPPNRFGLYDMVGNVWEWVEDCYHASYEVKTPQRTVDAPSDGSAWITGDCSWRVIRGGSWSNPPGSVRSASRQRIPADTRAIVAGFRVARTLDTR